MQDGRPEPSPAGRSSFIEPEPPEQVYVSHIILFLFILVYSCHFFNHVRIFPPFPEDSMSVDPPEDSLPANTTNGEQDSPERMREAPESLQSFRGVIDDSDHMDEDPSPFIDKINTPPAMGSSLSPGRGSLPGTSISNVPASISYDPIEHEEPIGTGLYLADSLSMFLLIF